MLRFVDGPWDGTERELDPVETGSAAHESFYTDDPGAGCYKVIDGATAEQEREPLTVVWHPSPLRG